MDNRPNFPRSLASRQKIVLDLIRDGTEGVAIYKSQVAKENSHKDWAPEDLVNGDLRGHTLSVSPFDFTVKPIVKVVSRGAVIDKTEDCEFD
mmetsp:Transcript_24064/g.35607  ORF Transcript_24064/g.35607 Transcript_24064/m.35607 type:complete len:92 (-) Transcript_24064:810-1085(-)